VRDLRANDRQTSRAIAQFNQAPAGRHALHIRRAETELYTSHVHSGACRVQLARSTELAENQQQIFDVNCAIEVYVGS
jgi:hypothetical protein